MHTPQLPLKVTLMTRWVLNPWRYTVPTLLKHRNISGWSAYCPCQRLVLGLLRWPQTRGQSRNNLQETLKNLGFFCEITEKQALKRLEYSWSHSNVQWMQD